MPSAPKYGWVKEALQEAGKFQRDLAEAWDCDEAVVSRWIKTGEPVLTAARAKVLAGMIDMTREELLSHIEMGTTPKKSSLMRAVAARERPAAPAVAASTPGGVLGVIRELEAAVARAQAQLPPNLKIIFSIEEE